MYVFTLFRAVRMVAALVLLGAAAAFVAFPAPALGQAAVLTQNNDNARTGANLQETTLTPATVNVSQFGKLFTRTLDGNVNGQVLYMPQIAIGGVTRNVIFASTSGITNGSSSSVYAFDADDSDASAPLWRHVLPLSAEWTTCAPVIDPVTGIIYALTKENDDNGQTRLHALDITTGNEEPGSPVTVAASVPGTGDASAGGMVSFDTTQANCRPALLLSNGIVYVAFSHNTDSPPYHGWILGYHYGGAQFTQIGAFCSTPDGGDGGIWMAGKGLSADADGNIYCTVGNGTFDVATGGRDYGMCFLKLSPALQVLDWFAPYDELFQSQDDLDTGNVGVILLPGTSRLFTGGTKFGSAFLADTTNLGGFTVNGPDSVLQRIDNLTPEDSPGQNPVCWDAGAFQYVYLWAYGGYLQQLRYDTSAGKLNPAGVYKTALIGNNGGSLAVSANGSSGGIVWVADNTSVLRAFDASDVTKPELWDSNLNAGRDWLPSVGHFQFPTVANGKVYVPTGANSIAVYGLLPAASPAGVHFLWDNTNGQASLWSQDPTTGVVTQSNYGPFDGWTAQSVAEGSNGSVDLMWTNANGQIALWAIDSTGNITSTTYGPFAGWTAQAMSAAPGNILHVLWTQADGTAAVWQVTSTDVTSPVYGPFPGWTARALADGPDGQTRLLWNTTDGQASLWCVDPSDNYQHWEYGPYPGWTVSAVASDPDTQTRLVWGKTDGTISLWSVDSAGATTHREYGPYPGWTTAGIALGSDDLPRLLWNLPGGAVTFWRLDNTGAFTYDVYGPYPGWSAVSLSAGP